MLANIIFKGVLNSWEIFARKSVLNFSHSTFSSKEATFSSSFEKLVTSLPVINISCVSCW